MHTSTTPTTTPLPWTPTELVEASGGTWVGKPPTQSIRRILTDSRAIQPGDGFLALRGERFDAHHFVAEVTAQGAACVIVDHAIDGLNVPQLVVTDTRVALGNLGRYRRAQYPDLKVIALTGSSGKTTTKEMLGSILRPLGETLVTRGNLNNDLGVPMMLLELRSEHQFAVMELGASHRGEIDYTAAMVQPDVAGILNIGTAHMGEFGGRNGILTAKSEIYPHIKHGGTAIVPTQDDFAAEIKQAASARTLLTFGQGGDIYAEHVQLFAQSSQFELVTPHGRVMVHLPFAGAHNIHNAEAAAAFALALGVTPQQIAQGLAHASNAQGRLNFKQHGRFLLIDDSYNANPHSMRAAADVLAQQHGIKVLVMGEIGELGDESASEHQQLGHDLAAKSLDYIVAVGAQVDQVKHGFLQADMPHAMCLTATDHAQALQILRDIVKQHPDEMAFLFKGSRFTRMEQLLAALVEKI